MIALPRITKGGVRELIDVRRVLLEELLKLGGVLAFGLGEVGEEGRQRAKGALRLAQLRLDRLIATIALRHD